MKVLILAVVVLLTGCLENPVPDVNRVNIIEENQQFAISRRAPFPQPILPDIELMWEQVNECLGTDFEAINIYIEMINGSEVKPGFNGTVHYTQAYIRIVDSDHVGWNVLRHEFEHYIKYLRGDSYQSNKNHINWSNC